MPFTFEITRRSYSIKIPQPRFVRLLDSESHVTNHAAMEKGQSTLDEKLAKLPGVIDVEYSGHFGAYVHLTIEDEDDNEGLKTKIAETIETHLAWCAKLKRDPRYVTPRKKRPAAVPA